MPRILLLSLIALATLYELILTGIAFFAPTSLLGQNGFPLNAATSYLATIIAWLLLFVSFISALVLWQTWQKQSNYAVLGYGLAFWWIGIGVGIYLSFGKPDNLFSDSLKGFVMVVLIRWNQVVYKR